MVFLRQCSCSLLPVCPHPVTSRADWIRHQAVLQQDRINELLNQPSENESAESKEYLTDPPSSDKVSSTGSRANPYPAQEYSSSVHESPGREPENHDQPSRSEITTLAQSDDENLAGVEEAIGTVIDDQDFEIDHSYSNSDDSIPFRSSIPDSTSGGTALNANLPDVTIPRNPSSSIQEMDWVAEQPDINRDDSVGNEDISGHAMWLIASEIETEATHSDIVSDLEEENEEPTFEYTTSDEDVESRSVASDEVGQMKRGFTEPADPSRPDIDQEDSTDIDEIYDAGGEGSSNAGEHSDDETFQYGNAKTLLDKDEILSISIHDIKLSHGLSRVASTDITHLIESLIGGDSAWDYRTTKKWIQKQTGVNAISYDCCRNSCMSFAMYAEKKECDYCQSPRWKPGTRIPFATHEYIPIIHRLRLWYADPERAGLLISYREQAEAHDNLVDYWTSAHYRDMKQLKKLFRMKTDLGFLLTTDGVQVFKAKTRFSIWPIALSCFNLPPDIRAKRQNILSVGFIPGPKGPKNLDSFLYPLIEEFRELQYGVKALNGCISNRLPKYDREFVLKAHICLIGADMVAREKLMKVTGNRSYCYCEYCLIRGVWNSGLYCPISPPTDAPDTAKLRKGSGYPWASWDRDDLPMRNDREFRRVAEHIARKGATDLSSKYGVKGLSILSQLTSIDFPRSFPPDSMHLWFENVIPDLVKHWRGKYRVSVDTEASVVDPDVNADAGSESAESDSSEEARRPRKRKRGIRGESKKAQNQPAQAKQKKPRPRHKEPKVIETDDEYNIPLHEWETMSKEIASSASSFPLVFGPLLRNFLDHVHEMTAAEWQLFTFLLAPVYLKGLLPDKDYDEVCSLIDAIQISCDYYITFEEVEEIKDKINQFSEYYEQRYYRREWSRLKTCLPVMHQILHVPQALLWAGPMYVYSQWSMERFCGTLAGAAKSRVSTNRNISNTITMIEQKNALLYVIEHDNPETSDEDQDGNIRLATFLNKRIRRARPIESKLIRNPGGKTLLFCGPSRVQKLERYERTCIEAFLLGEDHSQSRDDEDEDETELDFRADYLNIPTHCRIYRSADFNIGKIHGALYPFKAVSSVFQRSNQTRCSSLVRYEMPHKPGASPPGETQFAEILFFFTIEIPKELGYTKNRVLSNNGFDRLLIKEKERGVIRDRDENVAMLAYIRCFPTFRDGRLLYREGKGVKRVILASDIQELIGLLNKGRRQYIVRRYGAMF